MQKIEGISVWGEPLQEAVFQMKEALKHQASYGALMADHHIGYSVPVGGVIAYEEKICVNGVGFDIACGNKAVRLDCDLGLVKKNISKIMNEIQQQISFGVGRTNLEKLEHPLFEEVLWKEIPLLNSLKNRAREQLGTVGSGNHYVDIFVDEKERVWIGVHFGSRGLGHSICTHFVKKGGGKDGVHATPVVLDVQADLGESYLHCMELAGRYAYAGRDWVCEKVAKIIGAQIVEEIHNHHNFAWKETHFGKNWWVVRKGATPAFPGQTGFVGGSMGDLSYILEGQESPESQTSLYSTIHGAGRLLGRMQAKGKRDRKGRIIRQPRVDVKKHLEWMKKMGVELRGGDLDESPFAYKRIEKVIESHRNTIKILHVLKPLGVCMAHDKIVDPYKD